MRPDSCRDSTRPAFGFVEFLPYRLVSLFLVVADIEQQAGLWKLSRQPVQFRDKLQAVLEDLRAFPEVFFVGGRGFGEQQINIVLHLRKLHAQSIHIRPSAFDGLVQTPKFFRHFRPLFEIGRTGIDIFLSNVRLACQPADIGSMSRASSFNRADIVCARLHSLGARVELLHHALEDAKLPSIPEHRQDGDSEYPRGNIRIS